MLEHWSAIVADFQEFYGLDLSSGILTQRSWHWFQERITGLLNKSPGFTPDGRQMPLTRLGMALNPPPPPRK